MVRRSAGVPVCLQGVSDKRDPLKADDHCDVRYTTETEKLDHKP
jgi:hypothetical protein